MTQPFPPPIFVEALEPLTEGDFAELFATLAERGVPHVFEQQKWQMYSSLLWLIPTGVVIVITHSYLDGIVKEIGKEHYLWFKAAVSSLYRKFLGKNPEQSFILANVLGPARTPSHFSGNLSFFYASSSGHSVKLLFPLDVTADDYARSCEEFAKLLAAHIKGAASDPVASEVTYQAEAKAGAPGTISLLVFWDRHSQRFHVVDFDASGKTGALVTKPLGDA